VKYKLVFNLFRKYIETEIVSPRLEETVKRLKLKDQNESKDFLDSMLEHFIEKPLEMNWTICMFEIGDLIGGHSAVGNLLMRLIGHLAVNQSVQQDMHIEAQNAINREPNNDERLINLEHRPFMPLTEASILETLRIASSPIVPHVANQDTTLQGMVYLPVFLLLNRF
jgi:cytochrome P450 family 307 subfamily A